MSTISRDRHRSAVEKAGACEKPCGPRPRKLQKCSDILANQSLGFLDAEAPALFEFGTLLFLICYIEIDL